MKTMVREGGTNPGSLMRWPASFSVTMARIRSSMSWSEAPLRSRARRSWSSLLKRQVRTLPSAVRRMREQWPQKGCVTGAIRPISPGAPSANLYLRVDAAKDLFGGDHQFARPVTVGIEGHEFDEAHDYAAIAGKGCEGFHFVFVEAADENGVDFRRGERRGLHRVDAAHDGVISAGAGDFFELDGVERIETDVDAVQAGSD